MFWKRCIQLLYSSHTINFNTAIKVYVWTKTEFLGLIAFHYY